jgi:hypothetical protein
MLVRINCGVHRSYSIPEILAWVAFGAIVILGITFLALR